MASCTEAQADPIRRYGSNGGCCRYCHGRDALDLVSGRARTGRLFRIGACPGGASHEPDHKQESHKNDLQPPMTRGSVVS